MGAPRIADVWTLPLGPSGHRPAGKSIALIRRKLLGIGSGVDRFWGLWEDAGVYKTDCCCWSARMACCSMESEPRDSSCWVSRSRHLDSCRQVSGLPALHVRAGPGGRVARRTSGPRSVPYCLCAGSLTLGRWACAGPRT